MSIISQPWFWGVLIPVLGIVFGVGYAAISQILEHRERMAMIERGIHPDVAEPDTE
jgi:hypothetical protein